MAIFKRSKSLEEMDEKEFMDAWTAKGIAYEIVKAELKEFAVEHDRRLTLAEGERLAATLSDPQKAALMQVMRAKGIESSERFGHG